MQVFQDYVVKFDGVEYTIPARKMMGAIASVENVLTLSEAIGMAEKGKGSLSKIAQAYGALVRYAGAPVNVATDDYIYSQMISNDPKIQEAGNLLTVLLELMIPPSVKTNTKIDEKNLPLKGNAARPSARRSKR